LQAVLTSFAVTTPGVFLYHPGRRQVLPKLRAFIEHIRYQGAPAQHLSSPAPPKRRRGLASP
jgi:hypothetical protein